MERHLKLLSFLSRFWGAVHGYVLGDIAILAKERSVVAKIDYILARNNIGASGRTDQKYIRTPFMRWLEALARWCEGGWKQRNPSFASLFNQYRQFYNMSKLPPYSNTLQMRINLFRTIWGMRGTDILINEWLRILELGINLSTLLNNIAHIAPYELQAFKEFEKGITEQTGRFATMSISDLARCGRTASSVFLSTLHSSQGQEFKIVIIPDLENERLPSYFALRDNDLEEEKRLLYVGITRASEKVYLLYSGWYLTRWGSRKLTGRSRFLDDIMRAISQ